MKYYIAGFILLAFLGCGTCGIAYYTSADSIQITVTEKERVTSEETSKYLIFTENETFENSDDVFRGKFNSSDIYGRLKVGETYNVEVIGWRIPSMSMYRNIITVK